MTPEEYYEVVREKDPYVGATAGALAGALTGAAKAKQGKAKAALLGTGLGALGGAITAHVGGKALRHHQAKKVRRMAEDLNLRATPGHR